MSTRAVYTGYLVVGNVNFFVKALPVSHETRELALHLHHEACYNQVEHLYRCKYCKISLTSEEAVRGLAQPDGTAIFSKEELDQLRPESNKTILTEQAMSLAEVPWLSSNKCYYLVPGDGFAEKPYALFSQAMSQERVALLVSFVAYGRYNIGIVHPAETGLLLRTLYYHSERLFLKEDHGFESVPVPHTQKEIAPVREILTLLRKPLKYTEIDDPNAAALRALLQTKRERGQLVKASKQTAVTEASLEEDLRRSIAALKPKKGVKK